MKHKMLFLLTPIMVAALLTIPVHGETSGDIKVEGKGYFYYHHDASRGDGQSNSFDFSRMYIGANYILNDEFRVRYLTDIGHQDKTGNLEVFAKYAYVDWKIKDDLKLMMGLQGTYNWKQPEDAWGYRSIQYAPMEMFGKYWGDWAKEYSGYLEDWIKNPSTSSADSLKLVRRHKNFSNAGQYKMGSSADLGVGVEYKPTDITYVNLMIMNGSGYKQIEDNMYKNFQLRAGIFLLDNAVHVSGYYEMEPWRSVNEDGVEEAYMNTQWDAMASYAQKDRFTVGINANSKFFDSIEEINALCLSVFGHGYVIPQKLEALARYDMYNPGFNDVQVKPGDNKLESNGSLIILGLDYQAHEKVSIIPNFQMMSYEDSNRDPINSVLIHLYLKL